MRYQVIEEFADMQNNGKVYTVGETFPHEGVDPKRISELASYTNRLGVPLIKKSDTRSETKKKRARKAEE